MTQEPALKPAPASVVRSLSFDEIPGQSRLFLDYLRDPLALRNYYPNAVADPRDVSSFREQALAAYRVDRASLCDALDVVNRAAGAGDATSTNIQRLRSSDTVAVVTGQQAGLFTGPLYTIYKALSAIRLAEELTAAGTSAVPVFWVASEDHDIDEIDHVSLLGKTEGLKRIAYRAQAATEGASVGDIRFNGTVSSTIDELMTELPRTEFSDDVRQLLSRAYSSKETYGTSFSKLILSLLGSYGLILIDPLNDDIKRLASPIYAAAIECSDDIVKAIRSRDRELGKAGYTPQVQVDEDYFPLFWHDESGRRLALKHTGDGMFRVKGEKLQLHRDELLEFARNEPRRLSPGVTLRPVVQDFLLPTICYFGGGAEISYFAQNGEAYRVLERPVTPILHRQSFTIMEPRERRNMARFGWELKTLFAGRDALFIDAATRESPDTADLFARVQEAINAELDRLEQSVSKVDQTVAHSLAKRRKKITYHLETLKLKTLRAEARQNETMRRRIDDIFDSLLPHGVLQERELNVVTFINKYGPAFIDWVHDAIDLGDNGHRIIEI